MDQRRTRRVNFAGREVEAMQLNFRASGENWNEYLVDDGTVVRIKLVATEVFRIIDEYDADGNPQYIFRSGNVMVVSAPENLRRQPS